MQQNSLPSFPQHADADETPSHPPWSDGVTSARTKQQINKQGQPDKNKSTNDSLQSNEQTYAAKLKATRVVGTGTNKTGLKVSPRPHYIYIGCLDPETTTVNVIDYVLTNVGIRVPCRQLQTRNPAYTSFVITVHKEHVERVFNPAIWPSEAIIDFYHPPKSTRRHENRRQGTLYNRRENIRYTNQDNRNEHKYNSDTDTYEYSRQYNQDYYKDEHFSGYRYTGRDDRYPRHGTRDNIDDV